LPTLAVKPEREFGGQRFVRHRAAAAVWRPWRMDGFEARDLGIASATDGAAGACVVRAREGRSWREGAHGAELVFVYVLRGEATLRCKGRRSRLGEGDALVVPAGLRHALEDGSAHLELIEVTLPASAAVRPPRRWSPRASRARPA
jgi:mannose-6-phosphate isomerase-like protein (cupin superfamily)